MQERVLHISWTEPLTTQQTGVLICASLLGETCTFVKQRLALRTVVRMIGRAREDPWLGPWQSPMQPCRAESPRATHLSSGQAGWMYQLLRPTASPLRLYACGFLITIYRSLVL